VGLGFEMNYEETLQAIREIVAEREAIRQEIRRSAKHHEIALNALLYHYKNLKLLSLVNFCNTGKFL
jgi:hypothetical protein